MTRNAELDTRMSRHSRTRCRQRGIPEHLLRALLDQADRRVPVGEGSEALSVSRREAARLRRAGAAPALLERLDGLVVIVAPDGTIVSVLHGQDRRYFRAWG